MLVYQVNSVELTLSRSIPPYVRVKALGNMTSGGHTNPRLVELVSVMRPLDGIQDLEFVVDPPRRGGVRTQNLQEVVAELDMGQVPDWMKGVRVRAETNKMEKLF